LDHYYFSVYTVLEQKAKSIALDIAGCNYLDKKEGYDYDSRIYREKQECAYSALVDCIKKSTGIDWRKKWLKEAEIQYELLSKEAQTNA